MKIVLVNVRQSDSTVPPLGLLYIASSLEKAGFEVQLFDPFFDNEEYLARIEEINPDLIGFSVLTSSYGKAKKTIAKIKSLLPDAIYCAGGVHISSLPEESLTGLNLDFIILGEGEMTMVEACKRLAAKESLIGVEGVYYKDKLTNQIVKNPKRALVENLDELPPPAWHLLPMEKYLIPPGYIRSTYTKRSIVIFTSRGCPWDCIFCSSNVVFGRKTRYASVDYVINGLRDLIEKYRIDSFYFFDDTFTVNKNWVKEFCQRLIDGKINLRWGCQGRVDTVNDEILPLMKKSGCTQIDFGVESGSQKVLDAIRKRQTVAQIKNAFSLCRKYQIRPYASIIVGNPEEEIEDILLTASLLKEIKPVYVSVCYLQPMPGSQLYDMAIKNKWFTDDKTYSHGDWDFRKTIDSMMTIKLDKKTLREKRSML
ncbi:MAG: radical SAM protein, partial [Candidatus Omnitrophica bacterium]|nr:radical SAM protein [Candidatus Omnitrophota bacterium]